MTFTNKAAQGLQDRIQSKLPAVNADLIQISIFHSFCADLQRRYPRQASLLNGYQFLDEEGQFLFVYTHQKELGLDAILKGLPHEFFSEVIGAFNKATDKQVCPEDLTDWYQKNLDSCNPKVPSHWQERKAVAEAYAIYSRLLQKAGLTCISVGATDTPASDPQIMVEIYRYYVSS